MRSRLAAATVAGLLSTVLYAPPVSAGAPAEADPTTPTTPPAAGSLDETFGTAGAMIGDVFTKSATAESVAVQRDGRIVVAGTAFVRGYEEEEEEDAPPPDYDFGVVRYLPDGSLDPSFGDGGGVRTDVSGTGGWDKVAAVAVQRDGRIVVAGGTNSRATGGPSDIAIARYQADGGLDPSFGVGGLVVTDLGHQVSIETMAIQPNGKIVVAGASNPRAEIDYDVTVLRYDADGTLDETFGDGGAVLTSFTDTYVDSAQAIVFQRGGKIVVVGQTGVGRKDFALVRYENDGGVDASFGVNGVVRVDPTGTGQGGYPFAAVGQPDGKIVVVGSGIGLTVARFTRDGGLDTTFGAGGLVHTAASTGSLGRGTGVTVQPDGKIVAVGGWERVQFAGDMSFATVRYLRDGTLDASFGDGGVVATDVRQGDWAVSGAEAVALQRDGKIIVMGTIVGDYALVRYHP